MTVSHGSISSPSKRACTSSSLQPDTQSPPASRRPLHSRSTAIASSIPPSTERCRWNTCITTRGWCASASSVVFVKTKYASE